MTVGGELILILGGARSGKSAYAERLARERGGTVLFVATATAGDEDMGRRIAAHRAARAATWRTLEAPRNVAAQVAAHDLADTIILDCLTLLTSNLLLANEEAGEEAIARAVDAEIDALLAYIATTAITWIVVSNEVGMGLVPPYPLGRIYRDLLGRINARVAAQAARAYLLVAGLPLDLKRLMVE